MADLRLILGSGAIPCTIFICGERPGVQEHEAGRAFVGDAGEELWHRLYRACKIRRDDCYVTNLVKTFSTKPPTPEEIIRDAPLLRGELYKVRPSVIVTVGYHAARWFLPQFAGVKGDVFHGLAFYYTYGRLRPTTAIVVPIVHSAAALRQPDRYANQLVEDCAAVRRVLDGEQQPHTTRRLRVFSSGLAGFGREGSAVGVDTEGSPAAPEAVTLATDSHGLLLTHCSEVWNAAPSKFLGAAIRTSGRIYIHQLLGDWQTLAALGIDLATCQGRIDDTMLMAYLLGLPQSLKTLAYRLCGFEMSSYEELIAPIDEAQVRTLLGGLYAKVSTERDTIATRKKQDALAARRAKAAAKKAARSHDRHHREGDRGSARADRRATDRPSADGTGRHRGRDLREVRSAVHSQRDEIQHAPYPPPAYPPRAYASLTRLLSTTTAAEKTLRQRWEDSTFAPLLTLPPPPTWKDIPGPLRHEYAMTDAVAHKAVGEHLRPQLKAQGLQTIYQIDLAALPFLIRNEQVGLACDGDHLVRLSAVFAQEYARVLRKIEALAGRPVNPLAPDDTSDALLEVGVNLTKLTKSRTHYTTEDKYLKAKKHEHALVPLIISARQIHKMKATYADRLPRMLRDGRYYPDWRYTRTATGRLAEEIIILMPKHSKRGKKIRHAFHATEGHTLVSVDLSQIEMRCMAHLSQDRALLQVYRRGEDVHAHTAHTVLGAPKRKEDQDESTHRLPSKTFNFAIINGSTEYGILDQLHEHGLLSWTIEQVQEFLAEWFVVHKGVAEYWEQQKAMARRLGYVKDLFGRRRYLGAIHSTHPAIVRAAERQALCPIQATADAISKLWNAKVWKRVLVRRQQEGRRYAEPWVRTHDDTTVETDERIARTTADEMLALVPDVLCIPTLAEAKMGVTWDDLH